MHMEYGKLVDRNTRNTKYTNGNHLLVSPTHLQVGGRRPPFRAKEGTVDASNVSVMLEAFQIMLAGEYWLSTSNASALSPGLLQMD